MSRLNAGNVESFSPQTLSYGLQFLVSMPQIPVDRILQPCGLQDSVIPGAALLKGTGLLGQRCGQHIAQ